MANIFSNPWDEERQRKLRSPFTGVRPYQPSLSPGRAYGQIWDGNTGMGLMPGPSTPPGGPAPLPPNMQTPPKNYGPTYGGGQNPDPRYQPMIPGNENIGPDGRINQPFRENPDPRYRPMIPGPELIGGIIPGTPGYGGPGSEGYGLTTTDVVHYINTETGEKRSGPSSGYGGLGNLGPPWQMDDSMHKFFQQPKQGPPNTKFSPPGPPGYITPLPSPPNAGTGGPLPPGGGKNAVFDPSPNPPGYITPLPSPRPPITDDFLNSLPPGGGINRPSRPSNPPDYKQALLDTAGWSKFREPSRPESGGGQKFTGGLPLQGQGYNRQATSSASPSPAWGVGKTKRKF